MAIRVALSTSLCFLSLFYCGHLICPHEKLEPRASRRKQHYRLYVFSAKSFLGFWLWISNPTKNISARKTNNAIYCIKIAGQKNLNLKSQMCICLTWEFGLLAGVAGCSRVTGAHQLLRRNGTFSLPTFWNKGTEQSLGQNRKKWQPGSYTTNKISHNSKIVSVFPMHPNVRK